MAGPSFLVPDAQATNWVAIGDVTALGVTALTELGKKFEQFHGDPLIDLFEVRQLHTSAIMIERVIQGTGIAPIVKMGGNDVITDSANIEQRYVIPFSTRESDIIPEYLVNMLRQPGTPNALYGEQMVSDRVQRLTQRQNLTWKIMRTKLVLENGISYLDPRTGAKVDIPGFIPNSNIKTLVGTSNVFSDLENSRPVEVFRFMKTAMRNVAKAEPSVIFMSSELRDIISMNAQLITRQDGLLTAVASQFATFVDGQLTAICGMQIRTIDTIWTDPNTQSPANPNGTPAKVWPINKVLLAVTSHPEAPNTKPCRMDYCIGEGPGGIAGLWVRDGGNTIPPSAPGRAIQMGNTGVPYIFYPEWLGLLTVGNEADLAALIPQTLE